MKEKFRVKDKTGIVNWIIFAILLLYALTMIMLIFWGAITSFKHDFDFRLNAIGLPNTEVELFGWQWSNYVEVFKNFTVTPRTNTNLSIGLPEQLLYTIIYTFGSAFLQTSCFCIMAYICAKYNYFFSKIIYVTVVVTMVIPIIGSAPAMLSFMTKTGLYDTFLGSFLMKFNFLGMYFLVFHAIFRGISPEFSEAAIIDGANEWQVFITIMIPLVMPTFGTIFLIKFIEFWNDYMTPLMYLPTKPTIAYGVYQMSNNSDTGFATTPRRIASCMIMAIPILLLFILFRNKIMGNVTMGGVKE